MNYFLHDSKNLTFFFNVTQRIEPCFKYDSKNFFIKTQRIEPFSKYGSKNWIGFSNVTQRIELFSSDMTLRIELFLKYDSRKWTCFFSNMTQRIFFLKKLKEMIFFNISQITDFFMTQRIEPFFLWVWRKELNLFSVNMTQRIEPFFCEYDAKNWTFFLFASKNWTFFSEHDSKNSTFFFAWLTELNLFFWKMTQRIELF